MAGLVGPGLLAGTAQATSATLYFSPASGNINSQTVNVTVYTNTGGDPVNAVEADFSYPTSKLQFQSVDGSTSAFSVDAEHTGGNGSVKIARGNTSPVTGTAIVAVVHFLMIGTGSADLSFQGSSAVVRSTDNKSILSASPSVTYNLSGTPATPTSSSSNGNTPTDTAGGGSNGSTGYNGGSAVNLTPNGSAGSIFSNAFSVPTNTLKTAGIVGGAVLLTIVAFMVFRRLRRKQAVDYSAAQAPVPPAGPQATTPLDQPASGLSYPPENNDQNGFH